MSEPELWTRRTGSEVVCGKCGSLVMKPGLVRVPFDEAVERMTYAVPNELTFKAPEVLRPICARLLLAALGEGT